MKLFDPENLRSASTARTYPVEVKRLTRIIEEAVRDLPQWALARSGEREIRAVRETRVLGFENDVRVRLTPVGSSGASTNTWAEVESAARVGVWDLGQNKRNLKELLATIDQKLRDDS